MRRRTRRARRPRARRRRHHGDDDRGGGGEGRELIIARGMDVNSLDPQRAYCDTCQIFMTAVYETLIGLDPTTPRLVPRLATAWEGNAEQTEFTFTLDPAATFADGSPVTSEDVKFSWERSKGLQGSASYLVGSVEHDRGARRRHRQGHAERPELGVPRAGERAVPRHQSTRPVAEANGATARPDDRHRRAVVPRPTRPAAGRSCSAATPRATNCASPATTPTGARRRRSPR